MFKNILETRTVTALILSAILCGLSLQANAFIIKGVDKNSNIASYTDSFPSSDSSVSYFLYNISDSEYGFFAETGDWIRETYFTQLSSANHLSLNLGIGQNLLNSNLNAYLDFKVLLNNQEIYTFRVTSLNSAGSVIPIDVDFNSITAKTIVSNNITHNDAFTLDLAVFGYVRNQSSGSISLTYSEDYSVPVPATLALLSIGFVGIGFSSLQIFRRTVKSSQAMNFLNQQGFSTI